MDDEATFLDAIEADLQADAPRLVYADWLDRQGEQQRAEFIRLGVALARENPEIPAWTFRAIPRVYRPQALGLFGTWDSREAFHDFVFTPVGQQLYTRSAELCRLAGYFDLWPAAFYRRGFLECVHAPDLNAVTPEGHLREYLHAQAGPLRVTVRAGQRLAIRRWLLLPNLAMVERSS